jgi:ferredoxin-NADP reductase/predicted pyridoxine 5'-phosphate oxidase superfamily flavin-nucleotide-binding protein
MGHRFAEIAFTPTVRDLQTVNGSRASYSGMDLGDAYNHKLGERETDFIQSRDSFYMASVSETGWPYLQHRGGPVGFMKVLDDCHLGFADYSGNRQYVSAGNFEKNGRVALFFMDYPNRRRLKLLGRVRTVNVDDTENLVDSNYVAQIERGFIIQVEAFDWNCPQHITPRYSEAEAKEIFQSELHSETTYADHRNDAESDEQIANKDESENLTIGSGPLALKITATRQRSERVRSYELRAVDGSDLPEVEAGSHLRIPVRLINGKLVDRQYSISSDPAQRQYYEIAVLQEQEGRGGSKAVHDSFTLGTRLNADFPANQFALHSDNRPAVLIAGGIGITPLRSMAYSLTANGNDVDMHYACRTEDDFVFKSELEQIFGKRLHLYNSANKEFLSLPALLKELSDQAIVYVCGPQGLINAVKEEARVNDIAADRVRFELFS